MTVRDIDVPASRIMRDHIEKKLGIPRELYVSQKLFDQEIEVIFGRSWLLAGHESQLAEPGAYVTVDVGADSIIVARTDHGELAAFHNICRHRGSQLVENGCGKTRLFVCPYHQWTFRLDGNLQRAPKMPAGFDPSEYSLLRVHVDRWHGLIFINLAETPLQSLREMVEASHPVLAPFDLANAKVAHTIRYDVAANWKIVWENAQECYHCSVNHPELTRAFDLGAVSTEEFDTEVNNRSENYLVQYGQLPLREGAVSLTMDGKPASSKPMGEFAAGCAPYTATFQINPTMIMVTSPDYCMVMSDNPVATDRTEVLVHWLVRGDAEAGRDYDVDNMIKVWNQTLLQDWALCERTQRGIASRSYIPGPIATDEIMVAEFHSAYAGFLAAADL